MEEDRVGYYVERILQAFGVPYAAARVYRVLLLSGREMTIDELAEATGLGRSTVSQALRMLEHEGMVYYEKRGRRKLYRALSALHQLLLAPTRILESYIVPLREELEARLGRGGEPGGVLSELLEEVRLFEELAREIEDLIRSRTRGLGGRKTR